MPNKLAELIALVNFIPFTLPEHDQPPALPTLRGSSITDQLRWWQRSPDQLPALSDRSRTASFTGDEVKWTKNARYDLHKCLTSLPENFQHYIWGDSVPDLDPLVETADAKTCAMLWRGTYEAVARYERFDRLRTQLLRLAGYVKSLSLRNEPLPGDIQLPIVGLAQTVMNEEGIARVSSKDELLDAIDGVDVRLIRKCGNKKCRRIFWAGRIDIWGCTKKCADSIRMRRYRERYKADPTGFKLRRIDREEERAAKK